MSNKKHHSRINARMEKSRKRQAEREKAAAASLVASRYGNLINQLILQRCAISRVALISIIANIIFAVLLWKAKNG